MRSFFEISIDPPHPSAYRGGMSQATVDAPRSSSPPVDHWIDVRHRLHRIPELGYAEDLTAALIRSELDRLGIAYTASVPGAPTATVAVIGDPAKPCVALRADIDALPIAEMTGLQYESTHAGRMHACGHDGHTAILLATAAALLPIADQLPVCVKCFWQPAEEGGGGAVPLIEAGLLDGRLGPKPSAVFGLHGWPGLPLGMIATKPGELLAASDSFSVTFTGRGTHGAYPHLGRDPIVTAAEAVLNLQQIVSREIDPTEPAVVTVGKFHGGTATNVIPDTATIEGTARSLNEPTRRILAAAIKHRSEAIAAANGCRAEFAWQDGYPPLMNDAKQAAYVADTARKTFGPERFLPVARPSMGGEDFAFYLQHTPGCFFLLGIQRAGNATIIPLHSDRFDFADEAIDVGVKMFVALCRGFSG